MRIHSVLKLSCPKQMVPRLLKAHTVTCPTRHQRTVPDCGGSKDSKGYLSPPLKRAEKPGKVRMGFIPDEWFLFFHSKTGVSGPYVFGIAIANYLFSKELYVMEHEFYSALSIIPMMYFATTRLGPSLAKILDKDVDEFANALEKRRKDEMSIFEQIIKDGKEAQWRAEGQKFLMEAKKENVAMQLEAIYRERCMKVFLAVKDRMDYQVKLYRICAKIQQKWMIQWVIASVLKSITPEFEKAYLNSAIGNLAAIGSRVSK